MVTVSMVDASSPPQGMPQELFDAVCSRLTLERSESAVRTWQALTAEQKMEYRDYVDEFDWSRIRRGRHKTAARRLARGRKSPVPHGWERLLKEGLLTVVSGALGGWLSR